MLMKSTILKLGLSWGLILAILTMSNHSIAAAPIVDGQDAKAVQQSRADQQSQLMAELVLQLNQLQQEVRQLRGELEEQDYRMKQMSKQQRDLYVDLDRRIGAGIAQPSSTDETTGAVTNDSAVSGDVQSAYNKAFNLYKEKKYAFAKSSFKTFLAEYPEEALASNGHFWLGQLFLKDKEFDQAETQFKAVYEQFPGANKMDVAILKLGQLEELRGNVEAAKTYYLKVATDYPDATSGKTC